jgi:hypothetical protein
MRVTFSAVLTLIAASAFAQAVNYSVYFDPPPAVANGTSMPVTPIRATENGNVHARVYGIMTDAGETKGNHAYKFTLRAFGPKGQVCETSTTEQPFGPRGASRRIAYFEAVYPAERPSGSLITRTRMLRYSLWAIAIEQIPSGQIQEDTYTQNNVSPPADGTCCKLIVDFPSNATLRCGNVPTLPIH